MTKSEIGLHLKSLKIKAGITNYRIVKNTGISRDQILAIESGNTNYTIDSLLKYIQCINAQLHIK